MCIDFSSKYIFLASRGFQLKMLTKIGEENNDKVCYILIVKLDYFW